MAYANSGGVNIHYTEAGAGEAILFCHGVGGNGAAWWQQVGAFSGQYRCIAMDHRGFGRSPCGPEQFDVAAFGDDAIAVLDAAGVESAHVVCQSMGGWTGVQMALRHPQRVKSLVLCGTIGGFNLKSGLLAAETVHQRVASGTASSIALAADYPDKCPAGAFLYAEISAFNTCLGAINPVPKLVAPSVLVPLEAAGELAMPILVVAGRNDLIWAPEVLKELTGYFRAASYVELDAGHSPYFEVPEAFNQTLKHFLAA